MKHTALASLASIACLGLAQPAAALDFTGAVAPGTWAVTNTGTLSGGSPTLASAVFSTSQLTLTGSNSLSPGGDASSCVGGSFQVLGPCQLQVTRSLPGTYSFKWSYLTSDDAGPGGDLFGVIVDSSRIVISDPGGANAQSGSRAFTASSSFGFFLNCTDCLSGSATSTISQFNYTAAAAIPEPETYALFVAGVCGLAARLRQRKGAASRRSTS